MISRENLKQLGFLILISLLTGLVIGSFATYSIYIPFKLLKKAEVGVTLETNTILSYLRNHKLTGILTRISDLTYILQIHSGIDIYLKEAEVNLITVKYYMDLSEVYNNNYKILISLTKHCINEREVPYEQIQIWIDNLTDNLRELERIEKTYKILNVRERFRE